MLRAARMAKNSLSSASALAKGSSSSFSSRRAPRPRPLFRWFRPRSHVPFFCASPRQPGGWSQFKRSSAWWWPCLSCRFVSRLFDWCAWGCSRPSRSPPPPPRSSSSHPRPTGSCLRAYKSASASVSTELGATPRAGYSRRLGSVTATVTTARPVLMVVPAVPREEPPFPEGPEPRLAHRAPAANKCASDELSEFWKSPAGSHPPTTETIGTNAVVSAFPACS